MGAATTVKVCKLCGKDVSQLKRVKDPKGNYYCEECYVSAANKKQQPVVVSAGQAASAHEAAPHVKPQILTLGPAVAAPSPPVAPAGPLHAAPTDDPVEITPELVSSLAEGDELAPDLLPIETVDDDLAPVEEPAPAAKRITPVGQSAGKPGALPSHCPACGTPVISGRRLCIKCNRDVTMPLASSMTRADKPEVSDKVASMVGQSLKYAGMLAILAVIAVGAYALYITFIADGESYQPYPKTRAAAIHQFLEAVAAGTDKSYAKAFEMISYRARASDDPQQRNHYKRLLTKMNEDLTKKYGKDWLTTVELDPRSHQDITTSDDCELHTVRIGKDKDEYTISTQVQISMEEVIGNIPGRSKAEYPENGKNRYGVLSVAEYPVDWK